MKVWVSLTEPRTAVGEYPDNDDDDDDDDNNNNTRKTFDRFTTKDSYTWNITHNTESTAV